MKNKNYVSRYLFHLLKQHRGVAILYAILYFLAYPFSILMRILSMSIDHAKGYSPIVMSIYDPPFTLSFAVLATAVVTPYIIFSYLYKKSDMDTYFALPIKKPKLFLIQTFFAWLIQIVPVLIVNCLGYGISLIASQASPLFRMGLNGGEGHALLFSSLVFIMGSFFLMLPSILSILCTTSLFNGIIYGGVFNAFPSILFFLGRSYQENFPGFTSRVTQPLKEDLIGAGTVSLLKQESPVLFQANFLRAITSLWGGDYLFGIYTAQAGAMTIFMWVLFTFILSLPLLALASYLYKIRQAERIQSAYIFRYFYPVVIYSFGVVLLMFFLRSFIDMRYDWYVEALMVFLVGFALFYVIQIIRYYGWPKFFSNLGIYIIVFLLAFGLNFVLSKTQPRILTYQVPKLSQISKAQIVTAKYIDYSQEPDIDYSKPGIYFEPYGWVNIYKIYDTESKEEVDHVRQIHKAILKDMTDNKRMVTPESVGYHEGIAPIQIYYYNQKGKLIMVRTYDVYDKDLQKEIEMMVGYPLYEAKERKYINETEYNSLRLVTNVLFC